MGFNKRNKVSAQFNMSSLTDIIFLLLIFFMLTSTLVAPNALNLKLPGSSKSSSPSTSQITDVSISNSGSLRLDGSRITKGDLEKQLRSIARKKGRGKMDMTISPGKRTATADVVFVMDIARRLNINAILATEKD
ncbi:MAG: biopolymer transporter ExbD [Bacteroidota bacterium]